MPEEFAWEVVDKCEYAFLAMTAEDGSPYGLPVTIARGGRAIYFHSALEGRKVECLRRFSRVCLCCVGDTRVPPGKFTTLFESAAYAEQHGELPRSRRQEPEPDWGLEDHGGGDHWKGETMKNSGHPQGCPLFRFYFSRRWTVQPARL